MRESMPLKITPGSRSGFRAMLRNSKAGRRAFTLVEVMITVGLLTIGAASTVGALLLSNNNASLSRLKTGAGTVAQNQIDLFLSLQPYNPAKNQEPPELALGTRLTGSSAVPTVPI